MRGPASAYAALGLEPGADRSAVEEAYRRLIKRYHPDRSGGDASRAAEINRAYFELRQPPGRIEPKDEFPGWMGNAAAGRSNRSRTYQRKRRGRRRSRLWPVLILSLAVLLLIERERLVVEVPRWIDWLGDLQVPVLASGRGSAVRADSASLDGPLGETVIARAIGTAATLAGRGDDEALAQESRDCHRRMRSNPELAQLDRCAAFDDAAAAIADRDPMNDGGAFNASAVTARQMTAASLLSSDYLAIERRLDRIRARVELTLRPRSPLLPAHFLAVDDKPRAPVPADTGAAGDGD